MQKQPSEGFFKRDVTRNFQENISAGISFLIKLNSCRSVSSLKKEWCFLVSFANFLIAPFLKNTNGQLLLIIAVPKVVKEKLTNEAAGTNLSQKCKLPKRSRWKRGSRSSCSQMFFKIGFLKYFANSIGKYLCWSLFFKKLQIWRHATLLKRYFNKCFFLWNFQNFSETFFNRTAGKKTGATISEKYQNQMKKSISCRKN